jgi:16S rRNA (cytidine1402-2'-O)-methyltransferase
MDDRPVVYLIPSLLDDEAVETVPSYILSAVKKCRVFFVENERTARRFLKKLWKEMVIDEYEWVAVGKVEADVVSLFKQKIKEGKTIGIISEAGCPGVADPGQLLVHVAQELKIPVRPLVGPNSILLALMASGMNGQRFQFHGYLPIENADRVKAVRQLESESAKNNCTQIFIETPYRNNQLIDAVLKTCQSSTWFCIAANLTAASESVTTKSISEWKKNMPDMHKQPAIFLLYARQIS